MAVSLVQAVDDHDMAALDDNLETITARIKRGIHRKGQLNFGKQFDHYVRTTTLINVLRGWDSMDPIEQKKQFKWHLKEYAATPSTRQAVFECNNWGCSEILTIAANFLQHKSFVLAHPEGSQYEWTCSLYRSSTTTRGKKIYETDQQVPMEVGECIKAIQLAKMHDKERPLILRYWKEHYSAYVHTLQPAGQPPDETEEKIPGSSHSIEPIDLGGGIQLQMVPSESPAGTREQQLSQLSIAPQISEIVHDASGTRNTQLPARATFNKSTRTGTTVSSETRALDHSC